MAQHHTRVTVVPFMAALFIAVGAAAGCAGAPGTVLEQLSDARRLTAEMLVQFRTATDAGNRAVMADTDDAAVAFVKEAGQATEALVRDRDALRPLLEQLKYTDEARLLGEFGKHFAEYQELDRRILDLAVLNTNLKAQRLSFGPAQQEADAFRDALTALAPATVADAWQVTAVAATAVTAVREIQVLDAAHIPEADDGVMTNLEQRMSAAEASARAALRTLAGLVQPGSTAKLEAATAALDRFMAVNKELVTLSRRNSDVQSLALSLGRKRTLVAACDESLRALQAALAKRGFAGTR